MGDFTSIDDILDFAIKDELRASNLYADLAKRSKSGEMAKIFKQFSQEELGHKKKLEAIKSGKQALVPHEKVQDLKIGDYLVEVKTSRDDLTYQEALIIAMKEEFTAASGPPPLYIAKEWPLLDDLEEHVLEISTIHYVRT